MFIVDILLEGECKKPPKVQFNLCAESDLIIYDKGFLSISLLGETHGQFYHTH